MSSMNRNPGATSGRARRLACAAATLAVVGLGAASQAQALGFLFWSSTPVRGGSLAACYQLAFDTLQAQDFTQIARRADEVVGRSQGTFTTITCIGTRPRVTAVVMVIGDNENRTMEVRNRLRARLAASIPSAAP